MPRRRKKCPACSACSPAPIASPTSLAPIPHDPVPKTKFDMKLTGPNGGAVFIGPNALLPADKARHVGEAVAMVVAETKAQAMDAAEAVEVTLRGIAVRPAFRGRDAARRAGAVGRGAEQRHGGDRVRQCRGDRPGVRPRRACGDEEFSYRPRHRRAARAARRARPLRCRDRPLHALCRLRRRGAAEERARAGARHRAGKLARAFARCRRQFRHPQPHLRRVRPGAVGVAKRSAGR